MSEKRKYYGLKTLISIIQIVAWVVGILGGLFGVITMVNTFISGIIIFGVVFLSVIFILAVSGVFQVLIDIEYNTRNPKMNEGVKYSNLPSSDISAKNITSDEMNGLIKSLKDNEMIIKDINTHIINIITEEKWANILHAKTDNKYKILYHNE
jgi:hypothetical protein